jgi:hypothetical protein
MALPERAHQALGCSRLLSGTGRTGCVEPLPRVGPAMRTTGPTTWASFAGVEIFNRPLNPAAARCGLFGRKHPTNPFVLRQRCQIPPGSQSRPF